VSIPVDARSKAWVYGSSLAGIAGLNSAGGMDVSLLWVLCVVRERSLASGLSLVQRSHTECGVTEIGRGTSQERPRPTMAVEQ